MHLADVPVIHGISVVDCDSETAHSKTRCPISFAWSPSPRIFGFGCPACMSVAVAPTRSRNALIMTCIYACGSILSMSMSSLRMTSVHTSPGPVAVGTSRVRRPCPHRLRASPWTAQCIISYEQLQRRGALSHRLVTVVAICTCPSRYFSCTAHAGICH